MAGTRSACFAVVLALTLSGLALLRPAAAQPSPASRDAPQATRGPITRAEAIEIVRAHNTWRKKVGALSLRWAPDLAAQSQNRARQLASQGCIIEHEMLAGEVGENLYRAARLRAVGRDDALMSVTPADVVDAWGAESADYAPATGACASDRQCGHYTQIVWPTTEEVGCGMAVCPSLSQIWVCRYRPKGNVRILR